MDGLARPDLLPDRCASDSEEGAAEASPFDNGLTSTRNGGTRKTWGGDTRWLSRYRFRAKVLRRLVAAKAPTASNCAS
jgi:hypothetical protein